MTDQAREVRLTVNGSPRALEVEPAELLPDTLRDRLHLGSVRESCGVGVCGSCTVLLDGAPVSSCLLLTDLVDGSDIVTAEGLDDIGGETLQESFIEHEAFQCSYCIPGMTVAAHALLSSGKPVDADTVREHLAGNLCRCGCYPRIVEAVLAAAGRTPRPDENSAT